MNNFVYDIPTKMLFGKDQVENIEHELKSVASKVLICYGSDRVKKNGLLGKVTDVLDKNGMQYWELPKIQPNPRIDSVRDGVKIIKENNIDYILAVGAGSVIDCSKAISAASYYDEDPWQLFVKKPKLTKALPVGVVLTLAATGSEMNFNCVLSNVEEGIEHKTGYKDPLIRPKFAVCDPTNTYSVPKYQTAAGLVDIISHAFEQYFSPTKNTYLQDQLSLSVIKTCIKYGQKVLDEPNNYEARANIMWAGTLGLNGLLQLGKVGDWGTHQIEHAISAINDMTHGAGLAILFPAWLEYILIKEENVDRLYEYGKEVWKIEGEDQVKVAKKAIAITRDYFKSLGMPVYLEEANITPEHYNLVADKTCLFGNVGTVISLGKEEVIDILKLASENSNRN